MGRKTQGKKAQSLLEYVVLIGVIVGVLIAMRVFLVRVVQEKYRRSADVFGQGDQYSRGWTQVTNLDQPAGGGN